MKIKPHVYMQQSMIPWEVLEIPVVGMGIHAQETPQLCEKS